MFQGSSLDIYIHWTVFILGIGILVSGIAVFTSCRAFAIMVNFTNSKNTLKTKIYKAYYKYHSYYWVAFGLLLILHFMVTVVHVGLPSADVPYLQSHQAVLITSITNFLLVIIVLFSCRSFVSAVSFVTNRNILASSMYQKYYKYHSYFWVLLGLSLTTHIVFGLIHAINT